VERPADAQPSEQAKDDGLPDEKPDVQQPSVPFPPAVMGIEWHGTPQQVATACRNGGGTPMDPAASVEAYVRQLRGGLFPETTETLICDKPPIDVGFEGLLIVTFCSGHVCEVNFVNTEQSVAGFLSIQKRLVERYGESQSGENKKTSPSGAEEVEPADLDFDTLCDGLGVSLRRSWFWNTQEGNGGRILLIFTCRPGEQHLGLFYDNVQGMRLRMQEFQRRRENF